MEYYQAQLDKTDVSGTKVKNNDNKVVSDGESDGTNAKKDSGSVGDGSSGSADDEHLLKNDRRYLQCPAAVTMSHLQKFIRMKFGLTPEHKVSLFIIIIVIIVESD